MLDVIRSNAQSLGIKIAFGLIIVVFVFWGVGSYTGGTVSDIIVVNDRPITIYELHTLAANMTRQLKERQPDLTDDQLKQYQVRLRAAQQLIMNVILEQEAQRVGIAVTPFELRREIESLPYFKNQDGAFDPALYKQILENNGTTPANFEKSITSELLQRKLFEHVTAGTAVSETEARSLFNFLAERRTMDYVLFPLADFAEQATPTAEAVRAAYDEGRDSAFKVPAKADVEYLLLSADTLAGAFAPDEAAVQAFYDANKERFTTSEQVRARHILLLAPAGAEPGSEAEKQNQAAEQKIKELHKRLLAGEDFAELAKANSEDVASAQNGGELGWFGHGQMVPEFDAAAFALKPGEISEPIKTGYGYHIIQLEERQDAAPQPLETVREEIRQQLGSQQAAGKLQDILDQVLLAVMGGKDLATAAQTWKLTPKKSGLLDADALAATLGIKPEEAATLLTTASGTVKDTPFITKEGYVLVKVNETAPEGVMPFEEVQSEIEDRLRTENEARLAMEAAKTALGDIKDGKLPEALAARVKQSAPIARNGQIEGMGANGALTRALFAADSQNWFPEPYALAEGAVIARLGNVVPATEAMWEQDKPLLMDTMLRSRKEGLYRAFLQTLQNAAKVIVKDEKALEG
ncbi:MAG TPA: SurA N-terminal domain-containing protein [Candidatus Avidesulfovibrio excrementigallinarum]|nr:SurA N-terminal domain-containing protein [Candidatus Avidesulfovibrio excrementigallinarum]